MTESPASTLPLLLYRIDDQAEPSLLCELESCLSLNRLGELSASLYQGSNDSRLAFLASRKFACSRGDGNYSMVERCVLVLIWMINTGTCCNERSDSVNIAIECGHVQR